MNFIESYALNCGAKIGKPHLYTAFFPLPFPQYVSFHSDCVASAKNYDYFQDVLNIIAPVLTQHGIYIVQIGEAKDREYSNCISVKGQTNINQLAYIIKNSLLHFGAESFPIHVAAGFDVPLVALFSNNYINCTKPYFGSKDKQIFISSYDRAGLKPSFSNDENPKTINLIKPEEIAASIFKLLGIDFTIPFDSVFFGKKYSNYNIQEAFPDNTRILFNPEGQVEVRADREHTDAQLFGQIAQYKKSIVIMDKPINFNLLKQFKSNIAALAFKITETDHHDFLAQLESLGSKLILVSELPPEKVQQLKLRYYEFGVINPIEYIAEDKINELKKDLPKLYYRSAKITASKDKFYYSEAAVEKDIPMTDHLTYQPVIDEPSFWKGLDFVSIVRVK